MEQIINSSFVEMLVHNLNGHTLLKDASTNKYIDANNTHVKAYGFQKPQDIVGHNIWNLNDVMSTKWEENAKEVTLFDEQVIYTGKPVIHPRRIWLNAHGFVWVHHMSKLPVIGKSNTVTAILSLGEDLTNQLSLDELYELYKYFYKNKREAITKFMEHVGISQNMFHEMPNNNEVRTLIAKARFHTNKVVANHLNLALKTTDYYINQLGRKAKDLQLVLDILRLCN